MRLSALLRLWRHKNALTLRAAAGRIGIHPSTLARIERGEQMHGATLSALLVWLLGKEERLNEAFAFEAEDTVADEKAKNGSATSDLDLGEEAARQVDGEALIPGREKGSATSQAIEGEGPAESAIAEEQEAAAELPLHAVDQVPALCGVPADGIGSGAYGAAGTGAEVTG